MNKFKIEDRVNIVGKNISGKIAYIGKTYFSEGEWFGIILDDAKGRNNGSIDGERYFTCPPNYGIFVRSYQLRKKTIQEPEKKSQTTKMRYPNYLSNSLNSKFGNPDAANKLKTRKTVIPPVHRKNEVVDLENILKKQLMELSEITDQKREADENLRNMKIEMQKMATKLNKQSGVENNLRKQLNVVQNDVVSLKRKLCNTEIYLETSVKRRLKMNQAIEQLREITETAVIEKEIAEEKSEYFEVLMKDEVNKCKILEVEMEIMKNEMQLQCLNGVPSIHFVKQLENRNAVLSNALLKLRDLYQKLHQQLSDYENIVEKDSDEIKDLKESEKTKEQVISGYKEEVSELYDAIDGMINADDIVFEVTERNLKSEDKINHLYQVLYDTEDQLEIGEEVEETLQEINSICREEIECLDSKVKHTRMALDQRDFLLKRNEEVISKYRELITILRERNSKLSDEFERLFKEHKEAIITAESLKLKIHRERRKNLHDLIQIEEMKHDLESFKEELNYWSPFMPDSFFEEGGENYAIKVKLIVSKMGKKLNLLIELLQSSHCNYNVLKYEQLKSLAAETTFLAFAYQLLGFLKICNKSIDLTDTEQFLTLGKYHDIIIRKNEEIDSYLVCLCKEEIDRQICLDNIQETCCSLSQLLETKYVPKFEEVAINLECFLNIILISCKCIFSYCLALEVIDGATPEDKNKVKQLTKIVKKLKIYARSILNCVMDSEKEKIYFLPVVEDRVKANWKSINNVMDSLISFYYAFIEEHEECNSNMSDPGNVPLDGIICSLIQTEMDLENLQKEISSGEFLVEQADAYQITSPVYRWAQCKRQERQEIISNLRNKNASNELEIINLIETLQAREKQDAHINQIVVRDASQQTEEFSFSLLSGAGDNSSVVNHLQLKLHDMECSMKYLSQKNFELRVAPIKIHQDILTPLKVFSRPKYHPETHDICEMQRKLNKMSANLRGIIVPLVVDISGKSSCKKRKYNKYLAERNLICQEIKEELWTINLQMKKLKYSSRCIWSNTNPFSPRKVGYAGPIISSNKVLITETT